MENLLKKYYADKNVLITGGLGFIGSNLAIELVKYGAKITLVDSLIPEYGGNLYNIEPVKNRVNINISDVRDGHSMKYLVKGQDTLFNLAGQVSHIDSMTDPFTDLEINSLSQLSILEACRLNNPHIKIVYASTRQVYGKPTYLPVDEDHPLRPADVNGINKVSAEWYHLLYGEVHKIDSVVLRLTNTFGPRQLIKHNRQGFVGHFIRQIIENRPIRIFGDGQQKRDFNFVDDVVQALLISGANDDAIGKIYNLGSHEFCSLEEFVKTLIEVNGSGSYKIVPFPPEKKKIDIGDYYSDFKKIEHDLGWRPKVSVKEGLEKMVTYYKDHLSHYL